MFSIGGFNKEGEILRDNLRKLLMDSEWVQLEQQLVDRLIEGKYKKYYQVDKIAKVSVNDTKYAADRPAMEISVKDDTPGSIKREMYLAQTLKTGRDRRVRTLTRKTRTRKSTVTTRKKS